MEETMDLYLLILSGEYCAMSKQDSDRERDMVEGVQAPALKKQTTNSKKYVCIETRAAMGSLSSAFLLYRHQSSH